MFGSYEVNTLIKQSKIQYWTAWSFFYMKPFLKNPPCIFLELHINQNYDSTLYYPHSHRVDRCLLLSWGKHLLVWNHLLMMNVPMCPRIKMLGRSCPWNAQKSPQYLCLSPRGLFGHFLESLLKRGFLVKMAKG